MPHRPHPASTTPPAPQRRRTPRLSRWALGAIVLACAAGAHARTDMAEVALAARDTQTRCQMKLHHDAEEFVDCLDDLLKPLAKPTAHRLGIEYFGWVGALNSARMSLPGAMEAADRYLRRFRKTQKALRVADEALCRTVPGDCTQRIARMRQMEAEPPMNSQRFGPANRESGHKH
ncbi:MAG: hypothetical protein KF686_04955 [Ramlibacter sp.]|nr:hypothetical protein [Ramlibacter sp.]